MAGLWLGLVATLLAGGQFVTGILALQGPEGSQMPTSISAYPPTLYSLAGANLAYANLAGVDLSRTDLTNADLTGAELRGARLALHLLHGALLTDADLREATIVNEVMWD